MEYCPNLLHCIRRAGCSVNRTLGWCWRVWPIFHSAGCLTLGGCEDICLKILDSKGCLLLSIGLDKICAIYFLTTFFYYFFTQIFFF
ncbi:hypothetical protein BpHYR1_025629 [Brachionus plicatilis]|uniref:Uncharacterized protein n=1 Tax=Brachionus plicatilis TaxID=10195 RepID=A0A3M7SU25_BRAPC|nr:hypothetical protein BpHYR1_025629 [Brachionus plicatilis]